MYIWNEEKEKERDNKRFAAFKIFCFNEARQIYSELDFDKVILNFIDNGILEYRLSECDIPWYDFKEHKKAKNKALEVQDFISLNGYYINKIEELLIASFQYKTDYFSEYEKEKENIKEFVLKNITSDLDRRYKEIFGKSFTSSVYLK